MSDRKTVMAKELLPEQKSKLHDASVKLCRSIQKHRCLYDREQPYQKDIINKAWEEIAAECKDSVASCKARWTNIQIAFMRSRQATTSKKRQPNRSRDYYLNDVLDFYVPYMNTDSGKSSKGEYEQSPESEKKLPKADNLRIVLKKTHPADDSERKTSGNDTSTDYKKKLSSASSKSKVGTYCFKEPPSKVGTFIIKKTSEEKKKEARWDKESNQLNDFLGFDNPEETNRKEPERAEEGAAGGEEKQQEDTRQHRLRRACKRNVHTAEQQVQEAEPKRPKRCIVARRATLASFDVNSWSPSKTQPKPKQNSLLGSSGQKEPQQTKKQATQKMTTVKPKPLDQMLAVIPSDFVETQMNTSPLPEPQVAPKWPAILDQRGKEMTPKLVPMTLLPTQKCDRGMQHDSNAQFSNWDSDFLNSLRPQMTEMSGIQKLHFKQKVYKALIEVFESDSAGRGSDPQNASLTTTNEEIHLIHELATLVQAAKCTPELANPQQLAAGEASNAQLAAPDTSSTPINYNNSGRRVVPYRSAPSLHQVANEGEVPLQYFRKIVKVGENISSADGEKRRIYRILPKGAELNGTITPSSNGGGFIIPGSPVVSPPPAPPNAVDPLAPNTTPGKNLYRQVPVSGGTMLIRAANSGDVPSTTPPKLRPIMTVRSAVGGPSNGTAARQLVRRYSVCGSENMNLAASGAKTTKIMTTVTNSTPFTIMPKINLRTADSSRMVRATSSISPFKQPGAPTGQVAGTRITPISVNQFLSGNTGTLTNTATMAAIPHLADNFKGFTVYAKPPSSLSSFTTSSPATSVASTLSSFRRTPNANSTPDNSKATRTASNTRKKNDDPPKSQNESVSNKNTAAVIASDNFDPFNIKPEPMN